MRKFPIISFDAEYHTQSFTCNILISTKLNVAWKPKAFDEQSFNEISLQLYDAIFHHNKLLTN